MLSKYKDYISLLKDKLKVIDFILEDEDISSVTFGNGTSWKIIFEGDRFTESAPSYTIWIRNIEHSNVEISRIGFSLISIIEKDVSLPSFELENMLNF